jgi:hypothetical protein
MILHTNFPLKTSVPKGFGIIRLFLHHILHDGLSKNDFQIPPSQKNLGASQFQVKIL